MTSTFYIRGFNMFDDVLTHLRAVIFLVIIQLSWHNFCADFPHAQIFWDNLLNCLFSRSADLWSFEQSTDNRHTLPVLFPRYWPKSGLLKASHFWSLLLLFHDPLWTSCATQKHVCTIWFYLYTFTETFQVLVTEFPSTGLIISGLISCS